MGCPSIVTAGTYIIPCSHSMIEQTSFLVTQLFGDIFCTNSVNNLLFHYVPQLIYTHSEFQPCPLENQKFWTLELWYSLILRHIASVREYYCLKRWAFHSKSNIVRMISCERLNYSDQDNDPAKASWWPMPSTSRVRTAELWTQIESCFLNFLYFDFLFCMHFLLQHDSYVHMFCMTSYV